MKHGTVNAYNNGGCRCDPCRDARAEYYGARSRRRKSAKLDGFQMDPDRLALADLLNELFPLGLTDDCPARRALQPVGAVHSEP